MNKKVIIALICFSIVLSAGVITLGVLYGESRDENEESRNLLEAHYQQAYYTLLDEVNNMEISFAKLTVATGAGTQSELLRDTSKSAEVAANALSALSGADVTVETTMKFVNQTGDFSKYLTEKIEGGETLNEEEKNSIVKIHEMMITLGTELSRVKDKITEGYLFIDGLNDENGVLSTVFTDLNDTSVEYPELIYDGPFSDALIDKETKGLSGDDIDEARGREIIAEIFGADNAKDITFSGEWNGDIVTLNYECEIDGRDSTVQLSKQGGMLLSLNSYREVTDPALTDTECATLAKQFLEKLGYDDMVAVWSCNDDSTVYVNFAPLINGVVIYPDLIKIKVASDDGDVLGFEAVNYAFNHCERTLPTPALTAEQAATKLSDSIPATSARLCLIPYKTNAERLSYEFVLTSGGTYYIYIDAVSGEEINILYVVSTDGGDKLI